MKSIIVTVFVLTIVSVVPGVAFAQLGTIGNPIYVQDITPQDPFRDLDQRIQQQQLQSAINKQTQAIQNMTLQQTISSLKSQYGLSSYAACANRNRDCNSADPNAQARCVSYVQYCLQLTTKHSPTQEPIIQSIPQTNQSQKSVNSGDVLSRLDAMCLTISNTYLHRGVDGYNKCDCSSGYTWNLSKTACVVLQQAQPVVDSAGSSVNGSSVSAPPKTNNQVCQDSYGSHSVWNGTLNAQGGLICDCASGYKWNDGQTACIAIPKVATVSAPAVPLSAVEQQLLEKSVSAPIPTKQKRGFWGWLSSVLGF